MLKLKQIVHGASENDAALSVRETKTKYLSYRDVFGNSSHQTNVVNEAGKDRSVYQIVPGNIVILNQGQELTKVTSLLDWLKEKKGPLNNPYIGWRMLNHVALRTFFKFSASHITLFAKTKIERGLPLTLPRGCLIIGKNEP